MLKRLILVIQNLTLRQNQQGWFGDIGSQAFAVVVEITRQDEVRLYERLRARVQV